MKLLSDAAGFGGQAHVSQGRASHEAFANALAWAAKAAGAPGRYFKRKQIERRNAWFVAHMSDHIRRDVGFDPEMGPPGSRGR